MREGGESRNRHGKIKEGLTMKDILNLTLKKKWFDMILSGEKKEEYREIKDYWARRFVSIKRDMESESYAEMINDLKHPWKRHNGEGDLMRHFDATFKRFKKIRFTNGYGKDRPSIDVEFCGIIIGRGLIKWGAVPKVNYFILILGDVLAARNVEVIKGC